MSHSIRTCLWFRDGRGREAAEFYCSLIPKRLIELTLHADRSVSAKAFAAMMKQKKIEIADIEAAVRA